MKRISVLILGAGSRGMAYSRYAKTLAEQYEVVGVAEPIECRRHYVRDMFGLPEERCFQDYRDALAVGKIADAVFICVMDRDHFAPAMACIDLGYDLLLEKPITPTPEQCRDLCAAAEAKGVKVVICTVLRYTKVFIKLPKFQFIS